LAAAPKKDVIAAAFVCGNEDWYDTGIGLDSGDDASRCSLPSRTTLMIATMNSTMQSTTRTMMTMYNTVDDRPPAAAGFVVAFSAMTVDGATLPMALVFATLFVADFVAGVAAVSFGSLGSVSRSVDDVTCVDVIVVNFAVGVVDVVVGTFTMPSTKQSKNIDS
jgi:hypothetical protein